MCRGKGDVNCDVETDPLVPTAGGLWEERCHDSITTTSCIRHVWANVLLEWEAPADTHRKVAHGVDRMAEEVHHTVERVMHKRTAERIPQKYLSVRAKTHVCASPFCASASVTRIPRGKRDLVMRAQVCYPYRCTGGESAVAMRRAEAEAKATTLVGHLRNASGLLTSGGGVAAGADAGSGEWMRPGQAGEGLGGLKGLGFEGGGENFRGCAYSRSFYSSVRNQPPHLRLRRKVETVPRNREDLRGVPDGLCGAQVPGISPLRHGGAAAPHCPSLCSVLCAHLHNTSCANFLSELEA